MTETVWIFSEESEWKTTGGIGGRAFVFNLLKLTLTVTSKLYLMYFQPGMHSRQACPRTLYCLCA